MKYIDKFSKLVIPFIGLYILYTAYSYAENLDSCKCASNLKPYIDNIKMIEKVLIIFQIIGIAVNIGVIVLSPKDIIAWIPKPVLLSGFGIYFAILVIFIIYFVKNVYLFSEQLPKDCECALQWQLNIVYIQALLYTFSLFILFLVTLALLSVLLI